MEYLDITSKKDLVVYQNEILQLFEVSYGKPLDLSIWQWAYSENFFGDPIVCLAIEKSLIVGHYAVIPFRLRNNSGKLLNSYLSMTTMVAPSHQGKGLFTILAKRVYENGAKLYPDFMVFGFPNDNSVHGFKKHLGWRLQESKIAVANKQTLLQSVPFLKIYNDSSRFYPDLSNPEGLSWRMSKPGSEWVAFGGAYLKKFESHYDLMYYGSPKDLENIPDEISFNALIDSQVLAEAEFSETKPYRFGYYCSDNHSFPEFKLCMSMSDVF
ncbi:GNAT family N-acetyltransferase [Leptospira perolatii]|uniref:GNAT family N-acetyltransferase n=1 Tax=Leptospira perolatii TaxID=2023191 RepID=UPI0013FDE102|nr:GNAT family N-acetyltransferase [Leptospira perolatii]